MPTTIGGAVPIAEVLSRRWYLEIPEYQRDYAWDANDSLQLIKDFQEDLQLHNQSRTPPSYYLGTIVLALGETRETQTEQLSAAEIVDGQQRLATLTIFIACLRDLLPDGPRKDALENLIVSPHVSPPTPARFVLSLRGHDGEYLKKFVQQHGATLAPARQKVGSKRTIGLVRESVRKYFEQLPPAEREALADFIMKSCRVAVVTTRGREQAWRIFGRVNQRGKRLRTTDILKAIIIGAIPDSKRSYYLSIWEKYKRELGSDFDGDVLGRRYLFNYIAELGGRAGNILDSVIAQVQRRGAAAFMDEVFVPVGRAYSVVKKLDFKEGTQSQANEISALLKQLSWQPDDDWITIAILLLHRLSRTPDKLIAQLAVLDRYMYGQMLLKKNQYKLGFKKGDRLKLATKALVEADGDVDLQTILRWSPVEFRLIRNSLDYGLSSGAAKAILARLCLAAGEATLAKCDEIVRSKKWEVEHFVPISPQANHDWQAKLGPGKNVGQYAKKLGNLYLVPSWLNDELGNGSWSHKTAVLKKHSDVGVLPQGASLRANGWNSASVDARHNSLVASALQIWQLVAPKSPTGSPPPQARKPRARRRKGTKRP